MRVFSCYEPQEVLQKARAGGSALLWVKLSGENVVPFEHGAEMSAIVAKCDGVFRRVWGGESVREIKIVRLTEAFEQRSRLHNAQTVPAHVWKLRRCRKRTYRAGEQSKAVKCGRFLAARVERLKSEADTEKWDSARNGFK